MKLSTFLVTVFLVAFVSGEETKQEKTQTKKSKRKGCAALGYTDTLLCSSCDQMVEYFESVELGGNGDVKDLYAECNECCSSAAASDSAGVKSVYTKAYLQGK